MAIHSSNLCLGNPMDREAWQPIVHGVKELDMTQQLNNNNWENLAEFPPKAEKGESTSGYRGCTAPTSPLLTGTKGWLLSQGDGVGEGKTE